MSLRTGVVVATHPDDHSVDLVMTDDNSRLAGVQVLSGFGASSRTGKVDIPEVPEKKDKWDISAPTGQDMFAAVGYFGRIPIVVGFLYPQINQMLMSDPKMRFSRHQSDVYSLIDGDGNMEVRHPSGAYVRIGETADSLDLAGKNADGGLKIDRNTDRKVFVRVELAGSVAKLTITPEGECTLALDKSFNLEAGENINMTAAGDFVLNAEGKVAITSGGTTDIEAGGNASIKAPRIDFN